VAKWLDKIVQAYGQWKAIRYCDRMIAEGIKTNNMEQKYMFSMIKRGLLED
jgi:hypothetical protein